MLQLFFLFKRVFSILLGTIKQKRLVFENLMLVLMRHGKGRMFSNRCSISGPNKQKRLVLENLMPVLMKFWGRIFTHMFSSFSRPIKQKRLVFESLMPVLMRDKEGPDFLTRVYFQVLEGQLSRHGWFLQACAVSSTLGPNKQRRLVFKNLMPVLMTFRGRIFSNMCVFKLFTGVGFSHTWPHLAW